jgi:diamine N-acetyltransferase
MADAHDAPSISAISLDGPAVRLRPMTRADYGFMWQCRTHPEILYLWMQDRTLPSFEQYSHELEGSLSSKALTTLLIETIDGSAPVGYVFAYDFSAFDHTAFISIVIHPTYVRYGWAAEASILFLNYLFTYFDLRKASMEVFAFNQLALAPLLQLGARVEGRFRGQRYYQGAYHDVIRLAVMHAEWDQVAPRLLAALMRDDGHMAEANPFTPLPLETESEPERDVAENNGSPHRKRRPRQAVGSRATR